MEYEIENTDPQVFQAPKAEFANKVPKTANARFKGFRFKTRKAMTPYEKLEIFVEKFEDIVSAHFPDFKGTGKLKKHAEEKMKARLRKLKDKWYDVCTVGIVL